MVGCAYHRCMSMRGKGRAPLDAPVFLRMTAAERTRLKVACAEDNIAYTGFVLRALDERDAKRARQDARSRSPLHAGEDDDL